MTTTYAIGDIHGEKALLDDLHRRILADAAGRPGEKRVIYLGDYIDRGPDSRGVVATLMAAPMPFPAIFLMGNHEAMCLATDPEDWLYNGGQETLASYGGRIDDSHRRWMEGLALSHRAGPWFFVHAGVDPRLPLAAQDRETLLWIRAPFLDHAGDMPEGVVVVHGHTPRRRPEIRPNRIGIDTGACYGGALTCAILTDKLEGFLQAQHG